METERIGGVKPLINGQYAQKSGSFGYVEQPLIPFVKLHIKWVACRETFHARNAYEYYYSHNVGCGIDVANFIYKVEQHLGLEDKSSFMYTDSNSTCWVKVSQWWIDNLMRHMFFTICLRASLGWKRGEKDWRSVLMAHPYAIQTSAAVNRFLDGYTWFTGTHLAGWVNSLSLMEGKLATKLIKPYTKEQREEIAYYKWVHAGRPEGRAQEFWNETPFAPLG